MDDISNDIVERLRKIADSVSTSGFFVATFDEYVEAYREAANEIERLRTDLSDLEGVEEVNRSLVKRGDHYKDKSEKAEAEIERLLKERDELKDALRKERESRWSDPVIWK